MKPLKKLPLIAVTALLCSCGSNDRSPLANPATKTESSAFSYGKRGPVDMVESIYQNLLDSSVDLRSLQELQDEVRKQRKDSAAVFTAYDETSTSYYLSARSHIKNLHDSVTKAKLAALINASEIAYNEQKRQHETLLQTMDAKIAQLQTLNEELKILLTKKEIESYQKRNLPTAVPLRQLSRHLDQLLVKFDSATKKAGG